MSALGAYRGTRALVTGGAGFIGSHLVDALLDLGAAVRVLDDFSTGRRENLAHLGDRIELIEGDIRDAAACRKACEGATFVFHQAALGSVPQSMSEPSTTLDINVTGTARVLHAARDARVRRLVYASSSSVYGDDERLPKRVGQEGRPLSPYAVSKWMNEELAAVFTRCYGMEIVGLRYFNVYGPRQDPNGPYAAVVPRFFEMVARGEPPVVYGDGEQSRDFTFVRDAVRANLLAGVAPATAAGRVYNVGAGGTTTVNALANRVCEVMGSAVRPQHVAPRDGDIRHSLADFSETRKAIAWQPEIDLERGIELTREHYVR